jgi:hypothetical protein
VRHRNKWKDNIKMQFNEMDVMTWTGLILPRINTNVKKIMNIPEFLKNLFS